MNQDNDFFAIWTPRLQSVLRIVVGGLFLMHGSAKLLHIPHVAQFDNVQLMSLVGVAGVARAARRLSAADRTLHASGGVHPVGRNGRCLLHGAPAARPAADH